MKLPFCETCQTIHSKGDACPSAPLNLCPPTGVTGTVLPASPEGVACVPALIKGEHYDVSSLSFVGWTDGDGTGHEGYNVADYFRGGIYLGPDDHGIEPIANLPSPAEPVKVPASPVKDTPADPLEGLNEDEIGLRHAQSWSKAGIPDLGAHLDAPASPVDSVGVPACFVLMGGRNNVNISPEMPVDIEYSDGSVQIRTTVGELCDRFRSHAAKDAKIKALEQALKDCVESLSRLPDTDGAYRVTCLESAKAALALPCA